MKFNFELRDICIEGIKVGGIKIDTEMSISEIKNLSKVMREEAKELPGFINDMAKAAGLIKDLEETDSKKTMDKFAKVNELESKVNSLNKEIAKLRETYIKVESDPNYSTEFVVDINNRIQSKIAEVKAVRKELFELKAELGFLASEIALG